MMRLLYFFSTAVILFLSGINGYAQGVVTEGKIIYEITYPDMELDSQMLAVMPKESIVYFKNDLSRTDLDLGMGIKSSSILNSKTGEVTVLTDLMGTKTAMVITSNDQKKSKEQTKRAKMNVLITKQKMTIAGYECTKAVVFNHDDTSVEIYFTDKISARTTATIDWSDIKGFPMQYFLDQNGLRMKFKATQVISENVDKVVFTIPEGYKQITQEEMLKMMGEE